MALVVAASQSPGVQACVATFFDRDGV